MTKTAKTRPSAHTSSTPSLQESRQTLASETPSGSGSDTVDVSLDVTSVVLTTLRDVSSIPPVPFLSDAAGIAVNIIGVVQKARSNKDGFKKLAGDSCELVYAIIRAHKDVSSARDVSGDLAENLQQLVNTLTAIQKFAQEGASRNFFKALFRSGVDAGKIQDYRQNLQQSMRVFGLQTDISLRETVSKLASQQLEIIRELERRETRDPSGSTNSSSTLAPPPTPNPLINSVKGPIRVANVAGDMVSSKASKTTTATNSYNVMTNSAMNVGNKTAMTKTTANNHRS
ncbi:hypothetical protein AX14_006097 [Amanita brunnescens Koide BX004]|nr:hypothetical protein AX14_006097 [Amanita brunnescens Koide BX004]